MKKHSKIKKVSFNRTFEMNGETYYAHTYEFEDGGTLNANHKKQEPFKVGDEAEYEVTGEDKYGNNKGKVRKPSDFQSGSVKNDDARQKMIVAQSALSTAANFYRERSEGTEDSVIEFAERMYNWVMSK